MNSSLFRGISFGVVFLGIALFTVGLVFYAVFCKPQSCWTQSLLIPGAQASCNKTVDDSFHEFQVLSKNESSSLPVTTYVFNKELARIFVDQKFEEHIEEARYHSFYVDMVPNAVYHWQANFDRKVDIEFVGRTKSSKSHVFYEVEDVTKQSGTYTATEGSENARFYFSSSKKASGTFNLVVSWPYWNVTSVKPITVCKELPCDWVFSDDPATDNTNLWFVSVNEGKSTYHVIQRLWHNLALWISLMVVFIVLGLVAVAGGIILFTVSK